MFGLLTIDGRNVGKESEQLAGLTVLNTYCTWLLGIPVHCNDIQPLVTSRHSRHVSDNKKDTHFVLQSMIEVVVLAVFIAPKNSLKAVIIFLVATAQLLLLLQRKSKIDLRGLFNRT